MSARTDHRRKSVRLPGYDYAQSGAYYVTIVTQGRDCLFGKIVEGQMRLSAAGRVAHTCWLAIPEHFSHAELGAFIVMPNHVHGIILLHVSAPALVLPPVGAQHAAPLRAANRSPHVGAGSLGAIVRSYKAAVTREIGRHSGDALPIWQRNYYEHIIRNETDHRNVHDYIQINPLNWEADLEYQRG